MGKAEIIHAFHNRLHSIISTLDHSSAATPERILKADANGLPIEAINTDAEVAAAVGASHARQHDIIDPLDHTSGATPGQILQADVNGLPIDATNSDIQIAVAVALAHARQHAITNALDHTSAATPGKILKADANGLPVEAANTDAEVADAVAKRHTQGTDTALGAVGTKNPPIDADKPLYRDSTAGDALVTSTWAQIKAFLKTYFDTLYRLATADHTHQSTGAQAGKLDHGLALDGLSDDDHTQYIKHSLATAISDFLIASGAGAFVKKTLAEVKTILGLGTAAYTAATDYVAHTLATAANDFLVASGSGVFVKKTLAEVKTLLDWATDIATHAGLTTGVHGVGAGTVAKTSDITGTKLDDFTAPDDNTDLDVSTTKHGLAPKAVAPAAGLLNVYGIANAETAITNKAIFDATSPSTQALGDSAAVGTAMAAARRDHKHAMPSAATAAEINTGTDTTKPVTPDALAGSSIGSRIMYVKVINVATALTTGDGKTIVTIPIELNGMNLVLAHAAVYTVATGATLIAVQIRNVTDSVDMLSTKITLDASEFNSYTAATPPVIDATKDDVVTGDRIAVDIDAIGNTTSGNGLDVILTFQLP